MAMTMMLTRVSDMIISMARHARSEKRPAPVIESDAASVRIMLTALTQDIGCREADLLAPGSNGAISIFYDGVEIRGRKIESADLYREHFGALADIWSDVDA